MMVMPDKAEELLRKLEEACLSLDEKELPSIGTALINTLRQLYASDRSFFSDEVLARIQGCKSHIAAAEDLELEMQDFPFVQDQGAVDEITARLTCHNDLEEDSVISKRIKKEIRELLSRKAQLPTSGSRMRQSNLTNAIRSLNAAAPVCGHKCCEALMTLREGNGEFFWGCTLFPDCWGKRFLKREERERIPD